MQPKIKVNQLLGYLFIFFAMPVINFVFGLWFDSRLNLPRIPIFPLNLFIGMSVMVIGLNLGIKSTRQLFNAGIGLPWGEIDHEVETSKLIIDGLYAYSRNPMVLGYSILPLGMGIMFQSLGMALSMTPVVLLINIIIVKAREEPRLIERFGEEYKKYREKTPFLLPNWFVFFREYLVPYARSNMNQICYILLAEASLIITSFIVYQPILNFHFPSQVWVSNMIFASICALGIIAGIAPKWCSFGIRNERHHSELVAGHHPDCGKFKGHIVLVGGKVLCAGCSGLSLGASFAIFGIILNYFPFEADVGFWFGVLLVGLGLAQHYIDFGSGWVHLWLNFLFVKGAWFMFKAIQMMDLSFLISAYFISSTIFWIFARIRVSQWIHVGVCHQCNMICNIRFE
jgi:protein-S-isoprenylcysteine O-methyltransferase Ste14